MESVKQTAVEWLVDYIKNLEKYPYKTIQELEEQAKEMEKDQIENAYTTGVEEDVWNNPLRTGEIYYEETYGGNK
jgi:coenzyme F420-reducing hydrogenase alpha subunit